MPSDWPLIPTGISPGQSFRLLFVTSAKTEAESNDIEDYNAFVQHFASKNADLLPYNHQFRALISTIAVDARDNTGTTGPGAPIYWVKAHKAADDYADFYDGDWDTSWDPEDTGRGWLEQVAYTDENGNPTTASDGWGKVIYTGSNSDGTRHRNDVAGTATRGRQYNPLVRMGQLSEKMRRQ